MSSQATHPPATAADANWWRGAAIYQIYPRSFADSNDDGIGDLPGITRHLDYVASLDVDAVWISPFFTSPMMDFGYDVADFCDVDPIFGTLADFDRLVARAHTLGLRVIIDQVYSHTSDQHAWFRQSRMDRRNDKADWYVWADAKADGTPPTNWQSVFGGPAWTWDARRGQYFLHNFLASQPDLNLHNTGVQDAVLACAQFWLDRGVDGFRLDALDYAMHDPLLRDNPPAPPSERPRSRPLDYQLPLHNKSHPGIPQFIERIRALTDRNGGRFTVAEVGGMDAEPTMKAFTSGDRRFHSAYGFEFLYADSLTAARVRSILEAWPDQRDIGWPSWAFSNHDAPRAISRWCAPNGQEVYARFCLLLLTCLRGNIFLYQGEELGLPQATLKFSDLKDPEAIANWPLTLGRDGARTPMPWQRQAPNAGFSRGRPWLPVDASHLPRAVDVQDADPSSTLATARRLLRRRRHSAALRHGSLSFLTAREPLLQFERNAPGERLLCVFNFDSAQAQPIALPPRAWRVIESVGGADAEQLPPHSGLIAQWIG